MRPGRAALVGLLGLVLLVPGITTAVPPSAYVPVEASFTSVGDTRVEAPPQGTPIAALSASPQATPRPTATPARTAPPRHQPQQQAIAEPRATVSPRTSRSIKGKASWYCKAGVSVCHYQYPAGSMVAAACSKLRAAMGPDWRGRTVTVSTGSRQVRVKLVDWCASTDKLIDLYWEPMRRLGGTGVLNVTVGW